MTQKTYHKGGHGPGEAADTGQSGVRLEMLQLHVPDGLDLLTKGQLPGIQL